jgi:hypothetical protein
LQEVANVFIGMITEARTTIRGNAKNAEDILNSYTGKYYGNFVVVKHNSQTNTMETSFGSGDIIDKSLVRTEIKGRVEHDSVPGHIRYIIEEQQLRAWCSGMNYGYTDFKKQIEKEFAVSYAKKDLLAHTRGPQMRVSAVIITRPNPSAAHGTDEIPVD